MATEAPWHAGLPEPKPTKPPGSIDPDTLAKWIKTGRSVAVVDVRRDDFKDVYIKRAINLPAQSFHQTLAGSVPLLSRSQKVVFHCNSCSPSGRGPRCAGWFAEALERADLRAGCDVLVLEGGLKAFAEHHKDDAELIASC